MRRIIFAHLLVSRKSEKVIGIYLGYPQPNKKKIITSLVEIDYLTLELNCTFN